ncbi:velvet factor-domain-containing protein [Cercophora samala]|uniref:Velvet factor-domain-containing protein n=1 Tax=Cercophora samala TaxID=330535 RepID=A0AA40DF01_9PEZI|nr:velvet factor-domain-containing protein [Cercophora samala]
MSAVVDFAPHDFGRHPLLDVDSMSRPHHNYHEGYAPRHGHYAPEHPSFPPPHAPQLAQPPRLPSMATMMSTAGASHPPAMPNGREVSYPGAKPGYYSDYATPSPVGQTPPQFPGPSNDPHALSRRAVDIRRSPTLSSTASDRSSDEVAHEMRLRQMNSFRDHHGQGLPRQYPHQSPRSRGSSLHHDGTLPPVLMGGPSASPYAAPAASGYINGRSAPPPHLPQSPPNSTQASASPRQEGKSMSISNLLSSDSATTTATAAASTTPSTSHPSPNNNNNMNGITTTPSRPVYPPPQASPISPTSEYRISVRQQPYAARSCGFGERDRRVIDPPPIVQLTIHDPSLAPEELGRRLRHQFSVVHCSIYDEKGERDMSAMPEDFRQQRRLMGTLVASPFVGQDENGEEGCFFCFPDLSCRTPGSFRLKFALVVLDPMRMVMGDRSKIVATAMSEVFCVFNAKDFPGMKASTGLTKRLKEQGCLISIKKGNEKRETPGSTGSGGRRLEEDIDEGEEGGGEGDSEGDGEKRGRKRVKRSA